MFDDTFDFHNLGKLEPNQIKFYFDTFIKNSHTQGNKYLLIVTGKGFSTITSYGMVKKVVIRQLEINKYILNYKQAGEEWGGSGAFEVWLKD